MKAQIRTNMRVESMYNIQDKAKVKFLDVSPDGEMMAVVNDLDEITIFDLQARKSLLIVDASSSEITSMRYSRLGDLIFVGKRNGMVYIYSASTLSFMGKFQLIDSAIVALDISSDNSILITAGEDNTIYTWSYSDTTGVYDSIAVYSGHTDTITAVRLAPDHRSIVSSSMDTTVRLWRLGEQSCVQVFDEHTMGVTDVDITSNGSIAVSSSLDSTLTMWNIKPVVEMGKRSKYIAPLYRGVMRLEEKYFFAFSQEAIVKIIDLDNDAVCHSFTELHDDSVFAVSRDCSTLIISIGSVVMILAIQWDMESQSVDDWDERAQPYIQDYIISKKKYTGDGHVQCTGDEVDVLMQDLEYAGYQWIKKKTVEKKIKAFVSYYN